MSGGLRVPGVWVSALVSLHVMVYISLRVNPPLSPRMRSIRLAGFQ